MQTYDTGAVRDNEDNKYDYEGFLSPLVLERFAEYMHGCRAMDDGTVRASDNWQKGFPRERYMKSMWRHFMTVWRAHRYPEDSEVLEQALCALMFNTMGYLHEQMRTYQEMEFGTDMTPPVKF